MKNLGVYVHIPFCNARCIYCDFASTTFGIEKQNQYVDTLCNEIKSFWNSKTAQLSCNTHVAFNVENQNEKVSAKSLDCNISAQRQNEKVSAKSLDCNINAQRQNEKVSAKSLDCNINAQSQNDKHDYVVDTIYFGGGTPSVLSQVNFVKIVASIRENFACKIKEFSVEVNPNTASESLFECYKKCGVTRISFGVQTLNDKILLAIGRLHKGNDAIRAVEIAKKCGFEISVDLMLGLPEQTKDDIAEFVDKLGDCVGHVSTYMLKVEEGTKLFDLVQNEKISLPDDDYSVDLYECAYELLSKKGFDRYEVSNFCKQNKECRHNLKYWKLDEYLGFGLSSHSLFNQQRFFNTSDFESYVGGEVCNYTQEEELSIVELLSETIMLGLRLENGIDLTEINEKFGIDFEEKYKISIAKCQQYMTLKDNRLKINKQYFNVMNGILVEFV